MASTSKYSIPNEHNYSRASKQNNEGGPSRIEAKRTYTKVTNNVEILNEDRPNKINLPRAKSKIPFTMVTNYVKILNKDEQNEINLPKAKAKRPFTMVTNNVEMLNTVDLPEAKAKKPFTMVTNNIKMLSKKGPNKIDLPEDKSKETYTMVTNNVEMLNKDAPNKINLPKAKAKRPFTMVKGYRFKGNVKIPILKSVTEQNKSLFGILNTNKDLIALPANWFCEVSRNSIELPIRVTFFTLNNSCCTTNRYLEKQLVIHPDSEVTILVNGKHLIPSELGLKNYIKPFDINSLQNVIQEMDSFKICQGMSKQIVTLVSLRVFESNERWWHPNCSHIPEKNSYLCYSCKVLNSIILQVVGQQRRNHQQNPLPIDDSIPQVNRRNITKNQIKRKAPAKAMKIKKTIPIPEPGSESKDSI